MSFWVVEWIFKDKSFESFEAVLVVPVIPSIKWEAFLCGKVSKSFCCYDILGIWMLVLWKYAAVLLLSVTQPFSNFIDVNFANLFVYLYIFNICSNCIEIFLRGCISMAAVF